MAFKQLKDLIEWIADYHEMLENSIKYWPAAASRTSLAKSANHSPAAVTAILHANKTDLDYSISTTVWHKTTQPDFLALYSYRIATIC